MLMQDPTIANPTDFDLSPAESLPERTSREILSSRIGVGFETLDRQMFDPEKVYPYLSKLGAKWARVQTGWSRCETTPGQYNFAWLDEIVDKLIAIGVTPWFNLGFGNILYTQTAPHPSAVGWVPTLCGPEATYAWFRFVRALAEHFNDRVKRWEIWNEPNTPNFWHPSTPNAADYVTFVQQNAVLLREVDPRCFIIGGATSDNSVILMEDYLKSGLGKWIQAYSFHPYRMVPEFHYEAEIRTARGLLKQFAPHVELWQGENGCPCQERGHNDDWLGIYRMNEVIQAKWVIRRVISDLGFGLDFSSYFHAADLMAQEYIQSDGKKRGPVMMGLIRGDNYEPRLSFHALRHVCGLFDARTHNETFLAKVSLPRSAGLQTVKIPYIASETVTFHRGGQPLFAYWYPEDPQEITPPRPSTLYIFCRTAKELPNPVLVDVLRGTRHSPTSITRQNDGRMLVIENVPLTDYPLIITDRSVI